MPSGAFENRIRIRVNGILTKEDSLLMVQLRSPVNDKLIWMPPGGGVEFGESMRECLCREFSEETGLEIAVENLAFINELVEPPFHAVECYFLVRREGGSLALGTDPELPDDQQLLKDLKWIPFGRLAAMRIVPPQLSSWLEESGRPPVFYS